MNERHAVFWLAVVGISVVAGSAFGILIREGIQEPAGPPPVVVTRAPVSTPIALTPALAPASFSTPWATSTSEPR